MIRGFPKLTSYTNISDTYENIITNYPAANYNGKVAIATNIGMRGTFVLSNGQNWKPYNGTADFINLEKWVLIGGSGGTYTQSGTLLTVTLTNHGLTDANVNGARCHLSIATGLAVTNNYSNLQVINANVFTVVSSVSQTTSGNLAANTAETTCPIGYEIALNRLQPADSVAVTALKLVKPNANTKTTRCYFGNQLCMTNNQTTTPAWQFSVPSVITVLTTNAGVCTSAIASGFSVLATTSNTLVFKSQLTNASDWLVLFYTRLSITPNS